MPLSSPELLEVMPGGMAVTTVPEIVPRTQEIFGDTYQNGAFTQMEISPEDFTTEYRPDRKIRLTCVRKSKASCYNTRDVISGAFPFSLILESDNLNCYELRESKEEIKLLLRDNYVICPFTTVPKFRLLGLKINLKSSLGIQGGCFWTVKEIFICGQPHQNTPGQSLRRWIECFACDKTFLKSVQEARTKITDAMEDIFIRSQGNSEDVLP